MSITPQFSFNLSKVFKKVIIIIPIGILINLVFMFLSTEDKDILRHVRNFSPLYFLFAVIMVIIPWFANTFRLLIWTRFFGTRLSFMQTLKIIILSEFGAALSPSAVGSAPVKTGLLMQEKMAPGAALSLATIATLEDFTFFLIAVPTALTISSAWKLRVLTMFFEKLQTKLPWVMGILLFVALTIGVIRIITRLKKGKVNNNHNSHHTFLSRVMVKLRRAWADFKAAYGFMGKKGKIRFVATTALTAVQWTCRYSIITALVASMGLDYDPILFFGLQWIVFILSVFIPTPGATGGAEASFYLIFFSYLPRQSIGLITAGWRFLAFYGFLGIGAILYLCIYLFEKAAKRALPQGECLLMEEKNPQARKSPLVVTHR